MKLVSIVVPVYNSESYITRCVDSIIQQSHRDIEIILVNDGSSDESPGLCDNYAKKDKRIVAIHTPNFGVSAARNTGAKVSSGDYIIFIDSDDWVEPYAVGTMLAVLEKNDVDCVRTMFFENEGKQQRPVNQIMKEKKYLKNEIQHIIPLFIKGKEACYTPLLLIKMDVFRGLRGFSEILHIMEDKCFYMELLSSIDSIFMSNKKTYHVYINPTSASRSPKYYLRNMKEVVDVVNPLIKKTLSTNGIINKSFNQTVNKTHAGLVFAYLSNSYFYNKSINELEKTVNQLAENTQYQKLVLSLSPLESPFQWIAHNCILRGKTRIVVFLVDGRLLAKRVRYSIKGLFYGQEKSSEAVGAKK